MLPRVSVTNLWWTTRMAASSQVPLADELLHRSDVPVHQGQDHGLDRFARQAQQLFVEVL